MASADLKVQIRQMGTAAAIVEGISLIQEKSSVPHWDNRKGPRRARPHPPKAPAYKKCKFT